jgi:isopenicillin-N epimerase
VSWGYVAGDSTANQGHTGFDAYTGSTLLERRFQWQGTRDLAAFLSVPAAIDFQHRHDWPAVRERCHRVALNTQQCLLERFSLAPISQDDDWAQMVAIPVPHRDAESLRRSLFEQSHIEVPVTQHAGQTFVRISVQGYNTEDDLQRLLDAPALA